MEAPEATGVLRVSGGGEVVRRRPAKVTRGAEASSVASEFVLLVLSGC